MASKRCLYCYGALERGDFHPACSRRFFGTPEPPEVPFALDEMYELANQVIRSSVSVTGVQAKLSMDIQTFREAKKKSRFTIVGMWGRYVLKPPTENFPSLPEIEDLTMHLAGLFKIRTVPHSLIRIKSGDLAYVTRRVDRVNGEKLHMEDMCQLTERLTEDKYKGSMEQIGKVIKRYSDNVGFDLLEFFQLALFSFLTGNADMHLKNFSLMRTTDGLIALVPAYYLVATTIVLPEDEDESALTVNGKKRKLQRGDFESFAKSLGIGDVVLGNTFDRFADVLPKALDFTDRAFLSESLRDQYKRMLQERGERLGLNTSYMS